MWQKVFFLGCLASLLNLQSLTADQGDADVPQASPSSRHTEKVKAVREGRHDLVLIGDSITHCLGELDGKYAYLPSSSPRQWVMESPISTKS